MTEMPRFSPWCQMCLDGEDKGRMDAHALHVLRLKRERAKQPSKLQWQLVKIEPPAPGKAAQGEVSQFVPENPDEPEAGDHQPQNPAQDQQVAELLTGHFVEKIMPGVLPTNM